MRSGRYQIIWSRLASFQDAGGCDDGNPRVVAALDPGLMAGMPSASGGRVGRFHSIWSRLAFLRDAASADISCSPGGRCARPGDNGWDAFGIGAGQNATLDWNL